MTFKENLKKFRDTKLEINRTVVAVEVEETIDIDNDEDYETLCEFVYDFYMDTVGIDLNLICVTIDNALSEEEFTVDDIRKNGSEIYDILYYRLDQGYDA